MSKINFNSNEGRALLERISNERALKLDEIYKAFDEKNAQRQRGFIDALDWIVEIPTEDMKQEHEIGGVYDCIE